MKEGRSRRLWPILTAALIGLPVLYVASFGPAFWLLDAALARDWTVEGSRLQGFLYVFYAPILWLGEFGPTPISAWIIWYYNLFLR